MNNRLARAVPVSLDLGCRHTTIYHRLPDSSSPSFSLGLLSLCIAIPVVMGQDTEMGIALFLPIVGHPINQEKTWLRKREVVRITEQSLM